LQSAGAGVHLDQGAESGAQFVAGILELDAHRHALGNLDPVAGGILCRNDGKLGTGCQAQAVYRALPLLVGEAVEIDAYRLSGGNPGQISLDEVGFNPEPVTDQNRGNFSTLQKLSGLGKLADMTVDRGADSGLFQGARACCGSALAIR
jgi:hypothetical protein